MSIVMRLLLACLILIGTLSAAAAFPHSLRRCEIVRAEDASILYVCGSKLRSLTLRAGGMWQQVGRDLHGRFYFECLGIPSMSGRSGIYDLLVGQQSLQSQQAPRRLCEDEPILSGFFMPADEWRNSARDEEAIRDVFMQTRVVQGVEMHRIAPSCPAFDVTLHGLDGRAACFTEPGMPGHAIIMVAMDHDVGLVLSFHEKNVQADLLKDRFLSVLGQFRIERASGDSSLLLWFRERPR